ncbi:MAG TPA: helix-turn-helix domain-containing protein [Fontimonas sp.]
MDHKQPTAKTSNIQDARWVRSRAALGAALLALIEQRPFDQITVREITAEAGVGYATFFRHYESKEALLDDVAGDQVRQLVSRSLTALEDVETRAACLALCSYVDEHRKVWAALFGSGAKKAVQEELVRVSMIVASTRSSGWIPAELGVIVTASSTVEVLSWWLRQPEPMPAEQVAKMLDWLIMSPLIRLGSGI